MAHGRAVRGRKRPWAMDISTGYQRGNAAKKKRPRCGGTISWRRGRDGQAELATLIRQVKEGCSEHG